MTPTRAPALGHPPEGQRSDRRRPGRGRRRREGRGRPTRVAVTPKSCIMTARGRSISSVRTRCPVRRRPRDSGGRAVRRRRSRRRPAPRVSGSTFGWAVMGEARSPSKSCTRARSRSVETAWGNPDSTRARVVPGVADDVGVGRAVDRLARAAGRRRGPAWPPAAGPHPAVAVSGRLPVGQRDGVDHPVAGEPVVVGLVGGDGRRVGPVAQQPALEVGGEDPGDRELVVVAALGVHRRKVSFEVRVGHGCSSCRFPTTGPGPANRTVPPTVGSVRRVASRSPGPGVPTWQAETMAGLAETSVSGGSSTR